MTQETQTRIDALKNDFLSESRDGRYVHSNTAGAIKHQLKEGQAYSDYMMDGRRTGDELFRSARAVAQMVVNTVSNRPVRVSVGKKDSFTDGEQIVVATDQFDRKELTDGQKVDILCGFAAHEACHINDSDFEMLEKYIQSQRKEFQKIKQAIVNIIEDERIEQACGEKMPGIADFIASMKEYSFGKYRDASYDAMDNVSPENLPLVEMMDCIMKGIRYPSSMKEGLIERHLDRLEDMVSILTPFPETSDQVFDAAENIFDLLRDLVREEMKKKSPSGDGNEPTEQEVDDELAKRLADTSDKGAGQMVKILVAAVNAPDGQAKDANGNQNCSQDLGSEEAAYANGSAERRLNGSGAGSWAGRWTYIYRRHGDQDAYNRAKLAVQSLVPAMRRALTCKTQDRDFVLQGLKSGKLNTNKFASLAAGNPNIFTASGTVKSDSAFVAVLIDESGSMGTAEVRAARESAVLVKEGLKGVPNIEYFAYGFTSDTINIYSEPGKSDRYGLGSTDSIGGTPTAEAMKVVTERLRKKTNNAIILLVITDGQPDDTQKTIEQEAACRRQKVYPIGVGINAHTGVQKCFKEFAVISDMRELPQKVGGLVRRKLMKVLQSNVI